MGLKADERHWLKPTSNENKLKTPTYDVGKFSADSLANQNSVGYFTDGSFEFQQIV